LMSMWQQPDTSTTAAFTPEFVADASTTDPSAWQQFSVGLHDGNGSTVVTVGLRAVGGPVAVDDVNIRCGASTGQGVCTCDDGYVPVFSPVALGTSAYPVDSCSPTLRQAIFSDSRLSNFSALISAAGGVSLEEYLSSPGVNLTVIAPTDAAFATLAADVFMELLAGECGWVWSVRLEWL
jgi:hypothetical protein